MEIEFTEEGNQENPGYCHKARKSRKKGEANGPTPGNKHQMRHLYRAGRRIKGRECGLVLGVLRGTEREDC